MNFLSFPNSRKRARPFFLHHLPYAEEHVSVGEDPDVDVVDEDGVEVAGLLVAEKRVRHPNLLRVRQGQVTELA